MIPSSIHFSSKLQTSLQTSNTSQKGIPTDELAAEGESLTKTQTELNSQSALGFKNPEQSQFADVSYPAIPANRKSDGPMNTNPETL